jgi:uncharacterized protein YjbI with pentapeptide repeats
MTKMSSAKARFQTFYRSTLRDFRYLFGSIFRPERRYLYYMRIKIRVIALRLQLWWTTLSLSALIGPLPRPLTVFIVGLGLPLSFGFLAAHYFNDEFIQFWKKFQNLLLGSDASDRLMWKDGIQLLILLIGVPTAFILWAFRDHNVGATLANQRKDVNLKEFQEIQMRAAGALDEKLPASARLTLQIAALHQLRSFLRGDYGNSFRRPAWELLRALMLTQSNSAEMELIHSHISKFVERAQNDDLGPYHHRFEVQLEFEQMLSDIDETPLSSSLKSIIREDRYSIFEKTLPLEGANFQRLSIPFQAFLSNLVLKRCNFTAVDFAMGHFEFCDLSHAILRGARLWDANFQFSCLNFADFSGANMRQANLNYAAMRSINLKGALLNSAQLQFCNIELAVMTGAVGFQTIMYGANLQGVNLRFARLEGVCLENADLKEADLRESYISGNLLGANFSSADLRGAKLFIADFENAILFGKGVDNFEPTGALFDDTTELCSGWEDDTEEYRNELRNRFRQMGAQHIDDVDDSESVD